MSKIDAEQLVDLFKEEATKLEKKDLKKQRKKEKKLEKKENFEFKKLTELKENKKTNESPTVTSFLYDTFFGFCLILLLFVTGGFIYFNITKNNETKYIISSCLLGIFVVSYIHSQLFKNNNLKKFTTIIASISISAYMIYILYYFT